VDAEDVFGLASGRSGFASTAAERASVSSRDTLSGGCQAPGWDDVMSWRAALVFMWSAFASGTTASSLAITSATRQASARARSVTGRPGVQVGFAVSRHCRLISPQRLRLDRDAAKIAERQRPSNA
jgi:hypothetical protein